MISVSFEIPAATPESSLRVEVFDLGIHAGFIKSAIVTIPAGHKGLAFLQVSIPGGQLIPGNGSNPPFIFGENQEVKLTNINRRLDGPPYNIICRGYNLDSFFNHSFVINFEV